MINPIANAISSVAKAWTTYLEKKAGLYELHLRKRKNKAIDQAERSYTLIFEILYWVVPQLSGEAKKKLYKYIKRLRSEKERFDKLD